MGQLPHGVLPAGPACATARTPTAPAPIADDARGGRPRRRLHARQRPRAARDECAVAPAAGRRCRTGSGANAAYGVDGTRAFAGGPRGTFSTAREPDVGTVDVIATTSGCEDRDSDTERPAADLERAAVAAPIAVAQLAPAAAAPDLVATSRQWRVARDRTRFTRH